MMLLKQCVLCSLTQYSSTDAVINIIPGNRQIIDTTQTRQVFFRSDRADAKGVNVSFVQNCSNAEVTVCSPSYLHVASSTGPQVHNMLHQYFGKSKNLIPGSQSVV